MSLSHSERTNLKWKVQPMTQVPSLSKRMLLKGIAAGGFLAPELQALAQRGIYPKLLLGPMLGPSTQTSVSLWAMVNGVYDVVIEYADNDVFRNPMRTQSFPATQDNLYIVRPVIGGLSPSTTY